MITCEIDSIFWVQNPRHVFFFATPWGLWWYFKSTGMSRIICTNVTYASTMFWCNELSSLYDFGLCCNMIWYQLVRSDASLLFSQVLTAALSFWDLETYIQQPKQIHGLFALKGSLYVITYKDPSRQTSWDFKLFCGSSKLMDPT